MRETGQYLSLLFGRSHGQPSRVYDLLGARHGLGEESLYLNLGYWDGARTGDEAGEALARVLAEEAGLGPADHVLDVGFGFGDQDLFWARAFRPRRIVGVNVTLSQVARARARVGAAGEGDRVHLLNGSATALPVASSAFDVVLALETAFHFDTREDFFREAWRVLRPGGRLATADVLPLAGKGGALVRIGHHLGRSFWQMPARNLYPAATYADKLKAAAFTKVRVRSIREHVYEPFRRFARQRLKAPDVAARMHPLVRFFWKASVTVPHGFDALDYVLAAAVKPGGCA